MKELSIKERLEILREVKEEIPHYDEMSWASLSRLMGVNYPQTNADKILMLTKIRINQIQIRPEIGIKGY